MVCEDAREKIDEYLDGTLSPEETGLLEEHISSCPACSEELSLARAVRRALGELDELEVPPDFLDGIHKRIDAEKARTHQRLIYIRRFGALAACVVIAAAAYSGFNGGQFEKNGNELVEQERISSVPVHTAAPTTAPAEDVAPEMSAAPAEIAEAKKPAAVQSKAPAAHTPSAKSTPTATPAASADAAPETVTGAASVEVPAAVGAENAVSDSTVQTEDAGVSTLSENGNANEAENSSDCVAMFSSSAAPDSETAEKKSGGGGGSSRSAVQTIAVYIAAEDMPRAQALADAMFPDGYFADADEFARLRAALEAGGIEYTVSGESGGTKAEFNLIEK